MTKVVGCREREEEKTSSEDFAKSAIAAFEAMFAEMGPVARRFVPETVRLLACGRPVSPHRIAIALHMSRDEVTSILSLIGAELNQEGDVVGMGLRLNPTPHRFQVGGNTLFTWCATDALIFPAMLKQTALVVSPDPVTGAKIRLTVTPEGVEKVEPSSAVVSAITGIDPRDVIGDFQGTMCAYGHFFTSPETASKYISEHPGTIILSVEDALQSARLVTKRFMDVFEGVEEANQNEQDRSC